MHMSVSKYVGIDISLSLTDDGQVCGTNQGYSMIDSDIMIHYHSLSKDHTRSTNDNNSLC